MSVDGKLSIILEKRTDENGNIFHIGKLKAPIRISAKKGICFLIFTSLDGEEELQICSMTQKSKEKIPKERMK